MEKILKIEDIEKIIPHRYPFLLLDRVIDIVPCKYAKGFKNISINESFFQGHFINEKIMPGVLVIEALAQLTAVVYNYPTNTDIISSSSVYNNVGYLVKIKNIKFLNKVYPGDKLTLEVEKVNEFGIFIESRVKAEVDGRLICTGEIVVSKKEGEENGI